MKRTLPPHVYPKGKKGYLYFERAGETQRIHSPFPSDAFWAEYARIKSGVAPAPKGYTFKALIASYMRSERFTERKPRTRADYQKILAFLEERIGNLDPRKMQRKDVIRLQEANRETVRFANYCVQVTSVLMEHAIDIGWRDRNPAKGVKLIKGKSQPRQPWPDDLIAAFREHADDRALLLFELLVGTGQRIGDVLKARWNDVDADGIRFKQGKTGKELFIPFTPRLRAALDAAPKRGLTIVTKLDGGPLSYRMAHDAIMKVRRSIGAEAYDIHALRYSAANEIAELGLSDDHIAAITGHTTKAMLHQYAGRARQRARAAEVQRLRKNGPKDTT